MRCLISLRYMPTAHKAIKIIKREQRTPLQDEQGKASPSFKTENQVRREIFSTITSWVENQREAKKSYRKTF